jgi:hypothetical protein
MLPWIQTYALIRKVNNYMWEKFTHKKQKLLMNVAMTEDTLLALGTNWS